MKTFSKILALGSLVVTVVILASWSAPPKSIEANTAFTAESPRTLVLQPSYQKTLVLNDTSNYCLSCHGPYEQVQARTADYLYRGYKVQPHGYLDLARRNPHETTNITECLTCHVQHPEPWPTGDERKANLSYCVNCHHDGDLIHCSECHGSNY